MKVNLNAYKIDISDLDEKISEKIELSEENRSLKNEFTSISNEIHQITKQYNGQFMNGKSIKTIIDKLTLLQPRFDTCYDEGVKINIIIKQKKTSNDKIPSLEEEIENLENALHQYKKYKTSDA